MAAQELREKSSEQLQEMLAEVQREQFNLRVQKATGELSNPAQFKAVGRQIARIKTLLNEKKEQADS
ncbi:MAG: 50S ribosomal protein L29 [Gammaproteobacteria bacterium]